MPSGLRCSGRPRRLLSFDSGRANGHFSSLHKITALSCINSHASQGRNEFFDYALSFDTAAVIRQVEILNSVEAHAQNVHEHKP